MQRRVLLTELVPVPAGQERQDGGPWTPRRAKVHVSAKAVRRTPVKQLFANGDAAATVDTRAHSGNDQPATQQGELIRRVQAEQRRSKVAREGERRAALSLRQEEHAAAHLSRMHEARQRALPPELP